ncbi:MAG: M3 family metallopeptidase, partial [Planctomycetota bacterium]
MKKVKQLPPRSRVKASDCWDLSSLFAGDNAWEEAFTKWEKRIPGYAKFRGKLGQNARTLAACLKFDLDFDRAAERLGTYAHLKTAEDATKSDYQRMEGRFISAVSRASQAASYIRPEILSISAAKLRKLLADKRLAPYRLMLERLLRYKSHTLSAKEEKLLAMQTEMAQAAGHAFDQLDNADMKFGTVKDAKNQWIELSHATYSTLLHSPKRSLRKTAFHKYYRQYADHQHTLAATLNGSIQRDVYYARARNHSCALEAALFPDRMPVAVYENLIASVDRHLPALYRYY